MRRIAEWIVQLCRGQKAADTVRDEVRALCVAHPTPSGLVEQA
jgi:hypothetical protein